MELNNEFIFTQQSLATFNSCPLKFRKRYIEGLRWDDYSETEGPDAMKLGNEFHLLAKRYFLGIDTGLELSSGCHERMESWINSLRSRFPLNPAESYYPEHKLVNIDEGLRLEANFDLIISNDANVEIWDWKTHTGLHKSGSAQPTRLAGSLQTMVYLFVLGEKVQQLIGRKAELESISMHYWQPEPQAIIAEVHYSSMLHERFRIKLEQDIRKIMEYDYSRFDQSGSVKHCPYCEFRHLCGMQDLKPSNGQSGDIQEELLL